MTRDEYEMPDENTVGRHEARKALAESRRSTVKTNALVAQTSKAFSEIAEFRQANHFTHKFRAIIQGSRT